MQIAMCDMEASLARLLVSGLINVETTVRIDGFPLSYAPVRYPFFGVNTTVSGVGYNLAKALHTLGDEIVLVSMVGRDALAAFVTDALKSAQIDPARVIPLLRETPCSVILYDQDGQRAINVDLKDIQEAIYPTVHFDTALTDSAIAILCNINFSRRFLDRARRAGVPIATDVHAIGSLDDDYNRDFMSAATILAQSHEYLPVSPENWVHGLWDRYGTPIAIVGLGHQGALLGVRDHNFIERIPPVFTRPVMNTIGAGDALFAAFLHFYAKTNDPYNALQRAQVFASYKIGESGGASGFLTETEVDSWIVHLE
jgi:ribokinase